MQQKINKNGYVLFYQKRESPFVIITQWAKQTPAQRFTTTINKFNQSLDLLQKQLKPSYKKL